MWRRPAEHATRSTVSLPARCAVLLSVSSTVSSCRRPRTTATPTLSPACSRSSTRNASHVVSQCGRASSMQLWFGASNQTYVISARNFRRGSSIQSVSMVCRAIRRNSFCPEKLAEYGEVIRVRTANLPPREAGYVRLTFVGLQQRLLSSIAAFAKTLEVHRKGVLRADVAGSEAVAEEFV
jgi:hypothetical protein